MNSCASDESNTQNTAIPTESMPLAIATVPMQQWEQPYDPKSALNNGTIFPSLNLPFYVTGGGV